MNFVLQGKVNVGKTQTIRKLFDLLRGHRLCTKVDILMNNADICAVLEINNVKIGIESQGDPNSRL